ncbi:MAG: hypothetical protein ACRCSN_22530 [Dermatophilaceae bacterium]
MTDLGPAVDDRRREGDTVRLGSVARAWRTLVVAALAVGFTAGSLVGDDHWWPFAPWRMFSTSTPPGGAVVYLSIEVRTDRDSSWRPAGITPETVGLNRAEVEGRVLQIVADPSMLGTLAGAHARLRPDDPRWSGVRLVRNAAVLDGRAPTGEVRRTVLATWSASVP